MSKVAHLYLYLYLYSYHWRSKHWLPLLPHECHSNLAHGIHIVDSDGALTMFHIGEWDYGSPDDAVTGETLVTDFHQDAAKMTLQVVMMDRQLDDLAPHGIGAALLVRRYYSRITSAIPHGAVRILL